MGQDQAVIAYRFGFDPASGVDALEAAPLLGSSACFARRAQSRFPHYGPGLIGLVFD
jgi:hypothetical protein